MRDLLFDLGDSLIFHFLLRRYEGQSFGGWLKEEILLWSGAIAFAVTIFGLIKGYPLAVILGIPATALLWFLYWRSRRKSHTKWQEQRIETDKPKQESTWPPAREE